MGTENRVVCYARIKPVNKKFIMKKSIETGNTLADVVDAFMDSVRTGKPVKLKNKTPKYVQQAAKVNAKKKEKMKALTDKAKSSTKKTKKKTKARPKKRRGSAMNADVVAGMATL